MIDIIPSEVKSAIDGFLVVNNEVTLSGWCFFTDGQKKVKADNFFLFEDRIGDVVRISRPDIGTEDLFGFSINVNSLSVTGSLLSEHTPLFASYSNIKSPIKLWSCLRPTILSTFISYQLTQVDKSQIPACTKAFLDIVRCQNMDFEKKSTVFLLNEGFKAYDESVIAGREGHLFLYEGSNNLHKQYSDPANERVVSAWHRIFQSRNAEFTKRRIRWLQLLVPEKQSVLTDFYPHSIQGPTKSYNAIVKHLQGSCYETDIFDVLLTLHRSGLSPFRKVDTHLSFQGVFRSFLHCLTKLGFSDINVPVPETTTSFTSGDLGNKIGLGVFFEELAVPIDVNWPLANIKLINTYSYDPPNSHMLAARSWTNEQSQLAFRVLIFGNSISERGGSPFGLTWWFARLFRETFFLWSPSIDWSLVDEWKPDIVICQTVERFLTVLPRD